MKSILPDKPFFKFYVPCNPSFFNKERTDEKIKALKIEATDLLRQSENDPEKKQEATSILEKIRPFYQGKEDPLLLEKCCICFQHAFSSTPVTVGELALTHFGTEKLHELMCISCLLKWEKPSCPMCRDPVDQDQVKGLIELLLEKEISSLSYQEIKALAIKTFQQSLRRQNLFIDKVNSQLKNNNYARLKDAISGLKQFLNQEKQKEATSFFLQFLTKHNDIKLNELAEKSKVTQRLLIRFQEAIFAMRSNESNLHNKLLANFLQEMENEIDLLLSEINSLINLYSKQKNRSLVTTIIFGALMCAIIATAYLQSALLKK